MVTAGARGIGPYGDHLRLGEVGGIDGVILPTVGPEIATVVSQPIWRPSAFVPDDWRHDTAASSCPDCHRGKQLREPAISRYVVNIHLRATTAVMTIVRGKQLASLVDLQRLPGIKHRSRGEIPGWRWVSRIGEINDRYTHMRSVGRGECGAVIAARVAYAVLELGRLPVRAVALALADKLQVAVEPVKSCRPQVRRHLPLQRGLGVIAGAAHGSGYCKRSAEGGNGPAAAGKRR